MNVNGLRGVRAALDLRGMCVLWIGCARIPSHGDGVDAVCRACMRGCRVRERGAVKRRVPDLASQDLLQPRNDHASSFRRMGHHDGTSNRSMTLLNCTFTYLLLVSSDTVAEAIVHSQGVPTRSIQSTVRRHKLKFQPVLPNVERRPCVPCVF